MTTRDAASADGWTPRDPTYRRITLALFLAGVATFALAYAPQPLLPVLREEFGITPAAATLSLSTTTVTLGLALLVFGMLFPNRVIMPLFPPIPMKARTFVIVFGALELLLGLMDVGGVAHFAHLGGMVGGFLMIRFWRGQSPFGSRRR